jgi:hypothetical protein
MIKKLATLAFAACTLFAQISGQLVKDSNYTYKYHVTPVLLPLSPTDVVAQDVYVEEIDLVYPTTNTGNSVVTIQDKQGSPLPIWQGTLTPGTNVSFPYPSTRFSPGGITWSATATGVTGYISFRR